MGNYLQAYSHCLGALCNVPVEKKKTVPIEVPSAQKKKLPCPYKNKVLHIERFAVTPCNDYL